ncbi:MAG TPA: thiamine pyrophosphate-dependent enzyme, partial [Casimicrobiaceae bacterium]|nr:thiamine pyrophosphate-dependent enzyme [Casimicrobiaceae bacterium]
QRVMGPAHVVNVVDEAIKTALARRAVAHITIPKDIQEWTTDEEPRSSSNVSKHSADLYAAAFPVPPNHLIEAAAEIINEGSRIAILAGRGCLGARNEILELAQRAGAPIVKPLLGKAVVPDDNPYTTGGIGLLGTAPSQDALAECDVLVIAGSSFPYMEFYPTPGKAKCVQIDIDPSRIGLRYPADVGLVGDCRTVLTALLPHVESRRHRKFLEESQHRMKDWRHVLKERGTRSDMPMKPQVVTYELNKLLDDDAIVSSDSGTIATWSARYLDMREKMQFSLSGSLATMANGLPYSIGAAVAFPKRQVVCVVGDGGFTMLMGEIATLVKYDLRVKVIVIKNNVLGEIKWEQMVLEGNPEYGVELQPIDFEAYAKACGAGGFTIEKPKDAAKVLRAALDHPGPAVVQAVVDPNEPPFPGKISTKQALHFAEALARGERDRWEIIKTVMEDKVREVV